MTDFDYDIAIVGGGPVGIFAAFYAGLRSVRVVLLESLSTLGGQTTALYPQKNILDVAGFSNVSGTLLVDELVRQLDQFDIDIQTDTTVENVTPLDDSGIGFQLITNQKPLKVKSVIVATGKGAFEPRKIQLDNAEALEDDGLSYFVRPVDTYKNKKIGIAGGGDSAVDLAAMLSDVADEVHIIHRRDNYRALEHSINQLNQSDVVQHKPVKIEALEKQGDKIIAHLSGKEIDPYTVDFDEIIVNYGFISANETVLGWDAKPKIDERSQVFKMNQDMSTTVKGIFAVGDAATYIGKADLIATGFGEAPTAVNSAIRLFDPDRGGPTHSTAVVIEDGKVQ